MAIDPNSSASVAATNSARPAPPPNSALSSSRPIAPQIAHPVTMPNSIPNPIRIPSDQTVTVAANFSHPSAAANLVRSLSLPYIQQQQQPHHYNHPHVVSVKALPVSNAQASKVASSPVPESNGYKKMREKVRDDSLTIVRDRKVTVAEGSSLYAHCRSWLRNGFPEESQPQNGSALRSLPKPSSIPRNLQKQEGGDEEEQEQGGDDAEEEDEVSVEHLNIEDLFKRHVKRAKKVRARLREVRLKRIAKYKSRLALLLPLVDQSRSDATATGT